VINQVLEVADDQLRYPSVSELQAVENFMAAGIKRVQIAETLSENRKRIIDQAQKQLFSRRPEYRQVGGNAYGNKQYNQCLRDYDWYLRLATYGIIAGSKEPIESIGILGAREMYNSLNVPVPGMVDAIRCLKEAALGTLDAEGVAEATPYFDYMIQAMA
jgi:allophycocyanin-B